MPDEVPDLAGFEFAASALPARHVSGDLYDFVACGEASCHIVVGDIAGKGIPAAMLASAARALVQATAADGTPPGKMMADLRRSLHGDLEQAEMFLTFLCARLDPMSGRLTYASAGHTEPLWCRGEAGMSRLASTGLPLGIFPDSDIEEKTAWLRPGDRVVFYSDGVTEAANPEGERFGMARFQDLVCREREGTASALRDAVVEAVEAFRAGRPLSDDLTLVVLRALPRETTFRYPADLGHLREATRQVREAVGAYDEELQSQVELAASEILTNLVRHAYGDQSGDVEGRILAGADAIQLEFFDHGRPFDPDAQPPPDRDDPQEGGYGLLVVEGIMDEVEYRAGTPDGNYWRLVKRVPDRAEG
jgi:anti-sigma regulatory factor (Ser/Thr protein kinase)